MFQVITLLIGVMSDTADVGGDVAQEVELSSGSRRVAGSIPPWACRLSTLLIGVMSDTATNNTIPMFMLCLLRCC